MKQLILEFSIAFLIGVLGFSTLSGCMVNQADAYRIITNTKPTKVQRHISSVPMNSKLGRGEQ